MFARLSRLPSTIVEVLSNHFLNCAAMHPGVPTFILASASPRRRALLANAGYEFDVVPSGVEEPSATGFASAEAYVTHTAWLKASHVSLDANRWILAADTVVVLGDQIIGKPTDRTHAQTTLQLLRGTSHRVLTGVCLRLPRCALALTAAESTHVQMRAFHDDDLSAYLDSGRWEGKAGAYGIQDDLDPFVESIDGSFANIVGLPIEKVRQMLSCACRIEDYMHS